MTNNMQILDCTLRDGGYYNDWNFSPKTVKKYLDSIAKSGVSVVELGFRNFPDNKFLGMFAYTTDNFINTLQIPKNISIAVMINAGVITNHELPTDLALKKLFQPKETSKVDIVRVACHFHEIESSKHIFKYLKDLGYRVFLNLMQVSIRTDNELSDIAKTIKNFNTVDVLYFADSLGSMTNNDVLRILNIFNEFWEGKVGFHSHNNLGLALSNSLIAIDNGISWIDSTMMGMGRGAGNTPTENLLLDLNAKYKSSYNPEELYDVILDDFSSLQIKYRWGPNLAYNLSALNNIHPTYIQEILSRKNSSNKDLLNLIKFLSKIDATHFNRDYLNSDCGETKNPGTWDASNWCEKREVLILGAGPSIDEHEYGIKNYIKTYRPIVLSLNLKENYLSSLTDFYATANEQRILSDYEKYDNLQKPIFISIEFSRKILGRAIKAKKLLDYGINFSKEKFIIDNTSCTLPFELSIGYALCLCSIGCAKEINLVGFDGYESNDYRQNKVEDVFKKFQSISKIKLTSLTPTNYQISAGSIYAQKI